VISEKSIKKDKAILFINGTGGHKAQMVRLLHKLDIKNEINGMKLVAICEKGAVLKEFDEYYEVIPMRDKHSYLKTFITAPLLIFKISYLIFKLLKGNNIEVLISTGPGIVTFPAIIFKVLNKKIIFIETWSRYETQSFSGRVMSKLADEFYVQNRSLLNKYSNAIYSGRL